MTTATTKQLETKAKRVAAVRGELSEAKRWAAFGKPGAKAMVEALKKDLLALEKNLHDAMVAA